MLRLRTAAAAAISLAGSVLSGCEERPRVPPSNGTVMVSHHDPGARWEEWGRVAGAEIPAAERKKLETVQAAIDGLVDAQLVFAHPTRMRQGDSSTVTVALTFARDTAPIVARLQDVGVAIDGATVKIGEQAVAALSSTEFEVTPATPVKQWVSVEEPTEWTWQIKAKEVGTGTLYLTLDAVLVVDGKEAVRRRTFSRVIEVAVAFPRTLPEWWSFIIATGKDAEFAVLALGPLVLGLLAWWRRHRRAARADPINHPL